MHTAPFVCGVQRTRKSSFFEFNFLKAHIINLKEIVNDH